MTTNAGNVTATSRKTVRPLVNWYIVPTPSMILASATASVEQFTEQAEQLKDEATPIISYGPVVNAGVDAAAQEVMQDASPIAAALIAANASFSKAYVNAISPLVDAFNRSFAEVFLAVIDRK